MIKKIWRKTMPWFLFMALILSGCGGTAENAGPNGTTGGTAAMNGTLADAAALHGTTADTAALNGIPADTVASDGIPADTAASEAAARNQTAQDTISKTPPESTAADISAGSGAMSCVPEPPLTTKGTLRPSSSASKITAETNEHMDERNTSKSYYMQTNDDSTLVPCLTLSDDGTFTFSYDLLSSYLSYGTYTIEKDKLTARTNDGLHHFVFQAEKGRYVFLQDESSEISLIDKNIGIPVRDRAVFAPKEQDNENRAKMVGVVKEILEDRLLVSSVTDQFPGAFYVYFGSLDISGIRGGDKIKVTWNGNILETNPAQIYAEMIDVL